MFSNHHIELYIYAFPIIESDKRYFIEAQITKQIKIADIWN